MNKNIEFVEFDKELTLKCIKKYYDVLEEVENEY